MTRAKKEEGVNRQVHRETAMSSNCSNAVIFPSDGADWLDEAVLCVAVPSVDFVYCESFISGYGRFFLNRKVACD